MPRQAEGWTKGQKDGKMDIPYFIGPFQLLPGGPKKKLLLCSSYSSKKNLLTNHLNCNGRSLALQLGQYKTLFLRVISV